MKRGICEKIAVWTMEYKHTSLYIYLYIPLLAAKASSSSLVEMPFFLALAKSVSSCSLALFTTEADEIKYIKVGLLLSGLSINIYLICHPRTQGLYSEKLLRNAYNETTEYATLCCRCQFAIN